MQIIDLSQPLYDDCPNCPVHPRVAIEVVSSHAQSGPEGWHMEHLSFASHTGSHVDAPLHKIAGGRPIDGFPLDRWVGRARIVDLRGIQPGAQITPEALASQLPGPIDDNYILLATGWGNKRAKTSEWLREAPTLSLDAAHWLADHNARGVGIDHYSIGDGQAHAILLAKPVLIVEELFFPERVFSLTGEMEFWALPINLRGHSGAPCRPVLVTR